MRLLIFTQAVDKNDPVLGFFHRWVEEFAKHFDQIHVVCLKEGIHQLPAHVQVYSLGKENGVNHLKYVFRFYMYLWKLRGHYDRVFVHMNPHYVLLGGLFWKLQRIKIFFWRNHAKMNWMTQVAARFAEKIFYTSPFACTSRYAHARQMPVGIDVETFVPRVTAAHEKIKVLFLGRLSPVKKVEIFIDAVQFLGPEYEIHIYGDAPQKDAAYARTLQQQASERVSFHPGVTNTETPDIYRAHDIYVNLTPEGSMDKTVLEAVACGTQVIVTNTSFTHVVPPIAIVEGVTPERLAERIVSIAHLSNSERMEGAGRAREMVVEEHSLGKLAKMLHAYITE